jgi:hypothetical protein
MVVAIGMAALCASGRGCVVSGDFFPADDGFPPAGISVSLTVIPVFGVRRLAGKEKSVPGARSSVFGRAFATAGAGMTVERNRERQDGTVDASIGADTCWFSGIS